MLHELQNQQNIRWTMWWLYCWSSSYTCPPTLCTAIASCLSLPSSDLVFCFCTVLQYCWQSSLLLINSELLTCFQHWDTKCHGNSNNSTCDWWSWKRRRLLRNEKFLYMHIHLPAAAQRRKQHIRASWLNSKDQIIFWNFKPQLHFPFHRC